MRKNIVKIIIAFIIWGGFIVIGIQTFYFEDGVKLEESEFRIIPCSVSSVSSRNDYKPTPAVDEAAERILGRMNEYSAPFKVQFDEEGKVLK